MRELATIRWLFLLLVSMTVLAAASSLWSVLRVDSLTPLEGLLLAFFTILFAWIAAAFWIAALGGYALGRGWTLSGLAPEGPAESRTTARTAIVMPVHDEEARRVFAGLRAIVESIADVGALDRFDVYVLSDSGDPAAWLAEELEWERLRRFPGARIFYRHRPVNTRRKSGNIADFCENWGSLYDYMVVLDADSLMTGETLARLVGLMDANPRAGLIQAPPLLVGRASLFARLQQFASSVYGPVYGAGLALLQGEDGNYWGHNAIIRIRPFMQHCGLPDLPGNGPLGGEILSHDFVEAALLRRAGWGVWLAPELGGSYEEPPPALIDHLKRDRRWCHGNMQHLRLIAGRGLRGPSRMHFVVGAMTYLSAPLWALMLLVSAMVTAASPVVPPVTYFGRHPVLAFPMRHTLEFGLLVLATAALLYGPKLIGFLVLLRGSPPKLRAHGGAGRAAASLFLECLYSTLAAPIVMLSHTRFVLNIFLGFGSSWGRQQRTERAVPWFATAWNFLPHTLAGIAVGAAVYLYIPGSAGWFAPLVIGLVLAIPLAAIASDPRLGAWTRARGLFLIPAESEGLPILDRMNALLRDGSRIETGAALLRLVESDAAVSRLHRALLADVAADAKAPGAARG